MFHKAIMVLACLFALSGPSWAQDATGPIDNVSSSEVDAQIATRLRDILGELGDYGDVTVVVSDGVVTFRGTTDSLARASELDGLATRLDGVVAIRNDVTETAELGRRLDPVVERFQARMDQVLVRLPLVLISAIVFGLISFAGFALARMRWPWDGMAPNAFIADIYRQLVRIAFVIFAMVIALDILNATALLSTILGAAGIIGLAVGFAVRDTVENFIASILLSFRQPFRPNDNIEIGGDQGKVIRLTSRATILLSFEGNQIRIPNAIVYKSRIVNFTKNAELRFKFELLVDKSVDLSATNALITKTVQDLPFVIDTPSANAWIDRLETTGAAIVVVGWVDQRQTSLALAKSEAIRTVQHALDTAGIALVDATQDIALKRVAPHLSDAPNTPIAADKEPTDVQATQNAALDQMIIAERDNEAAENLLKPDAPIE